MAISVESVRTESMKNRLEKEQRSGLSHMDACELCRKPMKLTDIGDHQKFVALDHERYEFVTEDEATERGEAVSLFPVGADCERRIKRALRAA